MAWDYTGGAGVATDCFLNKNALLLFVIPAKAGI